VVYVCCNFALNQPVHKAGRREAQVYGCSSVAFLLCDGAWSKVARETVVFHNYGKLGGIGVCSLDPVTSPQLMVEVEVANDDLFIMRRSFYGLIQEWKRASSLGCSLCWVVDIMYHYMLLFFCSEC
jgi:hypothetical protein